MLYNSIPFCQTTSVCAYVCPLCTVCVSSLSLAAEVAVTAVDCSTLKVSYTVNPLPGGDENKASLQSFVVKYQPILGGGSTVTRTVPLNGNPAEGVLCLSSLAAGTSYHVTYNVEVNTSAIVPSDLADIEEEGTTEDSCDQRGQCIETNSNG